MAELKSLIQERGTIRGRVTAFQKYMKIIEAINSKVMPKVQLNELQFKLERFQNLLTVFDEVQRKIELLSEDTLEQERQIQERETMENHFCSLIVQAQNIIESCVDAQNLNDSSRNDGSLNSFESKSKSLNINLPTINLPSFDGNYLKWLEFRDTFRSMVNENESIPKINKFHYLRSVLEGSAAVVIKSIEFSSENYDVAWDLLCKRYDNTRLLVNDHLRALFSFQPIARESHQSLRYMIDYFTKHLRALGTLKEPTSFWDTLIIFMMTTKLDGATSRKWEEHRNSLTKPPTLESFCEFLRNRADVLETVHFCKTEQPKTDKHVQSKEPKYTKSFVAANSSSKSCIICSKNHFLYECDKFKNMNVDARSKEESRNNNIPNPSSSSQGGSANEQVSLSAMMPGQVLLCTAQVRIVDPNSNITYLVKALLDNGSQASFVTEELQRKINLPISHQNPIKVLGINNTVCAASQVCNIKIQSRVNSFHMMVSCLVIPHITNRLPNVEIDTSTLNLPANIELADPSFFNPSDIHMLLGADVFWEIVHGHQIKLGRNKPTLQESRLGWLISGPTGVGSGSGVHDKICNFFRNINESLPRFWEIEELPPLNRQKFSKVDEVCESHFLQNTKRTEEGRFSVLMPLSESPDRALGDSFNTAKCRFFSLEKKLDKFPILKKIYKAFIHEYERLGHLSPIERPPFGYYLPHHPVTRDQSETTPMRVVFDGSCKTTSDYTACKVGSAGRFVFDLVTFSL
ncbi:uncharacterized protein LOC134199734 [Bombyx mori]|uniref:uncharacterized protein LOC134199734 n=1 Tax=Bombyx mori TaxID=7091 RepID=UPI002ED0A0CE